MLESIIPDDRLKRCLYFSAGTDAWALCVAHLKEGYQLTHVRKTHNTLHEGQMTSVSAAPDPSNEFHSRRLNDWDRRSGLDGQFDFILVNMGCLVNNWAAFLRNCCKLLHENGELHIVELEISINDPSWYRVRDHGSVRVRMASWEGQLRDVLGEITMHKKAHFGAYQGEQRATALRYAQDMYSKLGQSCQDGEQPVLRLSETEPVLFCW
jgi:hypothetical protein